MYLFFGCKNLNKTGKCPLEFSTNVADEGYVGKQAGSIILSGAIATLGIQPVFSGKECPEIFT